MTAHLDQLRPLLPPDAIRTDPAALDQYGRDWVRLRNPDPTAILFPSDAEQTLRIVQWARAHRVPLVPSGGRTGLAGGALAERGQVVVSCERMNKILGVSAPDQTLTAQSGVTIKRVQDAAAAEGMLYPIDFAPSNTMQLGGTIATNAGGVHVVRYGMTRPWVAGLEVVTGAGELLDLSLAVPKNNTGYDLKQLFIGSEGTLGIITKATVRLAQARPFGSLALVGVPSLQAMIDCGHEAREFGPIVALEFWDAAAMQLALKHLGRESPIPASEEPLHSPWYVLAEFEEPRRASGWTGACHGLGLCQEGIVPSKGPNGSYQPGNSPQELWDIRLNIGAAVAPFTPYKNDISVPIAALPSFLKSLTVLLDGQRVGERLVVWGHLADGNVHVNYLKPPDISPEQFVIECRQIDDQLYQLVTSLGGSISAEHGIGLLKKHALHFSRSQAEIQAMRGIKKLFDPDNIMNPGKIFDTQ